MHLGEMLTSTCASSIHCHVFNIYFFISACLFETSVPSEALLLVSCVDPFRYLNAKWRSGDICTRQKCRFCYCSHAMTNVLISSVLHLIWKINLWCLTCEGHRFSMWNPSRTAFLFHHHLYNAALRSVQKSCQPHQKYLLFLPKKFRWNTRWPVVTKQGYSICVVERDWNKGLKIFYPLLGLLKRFCLFSSPFSNI